MAREVEIAKKIFDEIKKNALLEFGSSNKTIYEVVLVPEEIAINHDISLPMAERVIKLIKFLMFEEFRKLKFDVNIILQDVYRDSYSGERVRGYRFIIKKQLQHFFL